MTHSLPRAMAPLSSSSRASKFERGAQHLCPLPVRLLTLLSAAPPGDTTQARQSQRAYFSR